MIIKSLKMKKKLVTIITGYVLLFVLGIIACEKINDCDSFPNKFKVIGLDWNQSKAIYSDHPDAGLILSDITGDSVEYNMYSLNIKPRQETYFAQNCKRIEFGLMNTVYACSPVIPETDEKIDSIVIISSKDFDLNHLAGSNLSDLFDIVVFDQANSIYYEKYRLNEYVNSNPSVPIEMTIILREQPDMAEHFVFLVKYYQDGIDYDYFEFETPGIVLKKE